MLVGASALSTACAGNQAENNTVSVIEPEAAAVANASPDAPAKRASVDTPKLPASAANPNQPLAVPGLLPPTNSSDRLPQVTVRQSDPFSAAATLPTTPPPAPAVAAPAAVTRPAAPSNPAPATAPAARPAPAAQSAPSPAPQPAPATPAATTPTVSVPAATAASPVPAPVPSPTQIASAIEVSGVVQAGNITSAIVQVPNEGTSRYVSAGDYLANGRVLVKRIEVGTDGEPVVILEQNGVEVIRSVGSSGGSLVGTL